MVRPDKDEEREERIHMEIIVDAYGSEEQAMSWHNYLSDTLQFPFSARCIVRRTTSPLEPGEEVKFRHRSFSSLSLVTRSERTRLQHLH